MLFKAITVYFDKISKLLRWESHVKMAIINCIRKYVFINFNTKQN